MTRIEMTRIEMTRIEQIGEPAHLVRRYLTRRLSGRLHLCLLWAVVAGFLIPLGCRGNLTLPEDRRHFAACSFTPADAPLFDRVGITS
jgi:hypothetical protein